MGGHVRIRKKDEKRRDLERPTLTVTGSIQQNDLPIPRLRAGSWTPLRFDGAQNNFKPLIGTTCLSSRPRI